MSNGNMSVLGVFPPFWTDDGPHFILPHFQGMMKAYEVDAQIVDLNIEAAIALKERWFELSSNFIGVWSNPQIVAECIRESNIIGILRNSIATMQPSWVIFLSVNIASYQIVRLLLKDIRAEFSDLKIAIGGPLCLGVKNDSDIFADADLVWGGTLESAIPIISGHLEKKPAQNNDYRFFPDFTGIDITKYTKPEMLSYVLNYGCNFNCRYCHEGTQYDKAIMRPIHGLGNYLKKLLSEHPTIKYIRFFDSCINSSYEFFLELLDELNEKGILWGSYLTPMPYIDRSIGLKMRSAGCIGVNIGVESGSTAVRKLMGKPTRLDVVESCIRELHAIGMFISINLMVGYPGETEDNFSETLQFASRIAEFVNEITVGKTGIYAGTALFADAEKLKINLNGDIQNEFLFNHWALADKSNTPAIRREWLLRIEAHIEEMGLKNARLPDVEDPGKLALEQYQRLEKVE